MTPDDPRHGTWNGYQNLKCRCQDCRTAWAAYTFERRRLRAARLPDNPDVKHGEVNTYLNHGCRCRPCTDAQTVKARIRAALKDAT